MMNSFINPEINIKSFNSIYYFEFGKNFSHPPEKHKAWEMVYVDKGQIVAVTDGIGSTLRQGEAIFHEPWENHAHISDNQTANNMLVISFECDSDAMNFFKKKTFTLDKTSRTLLSLFMEEAKNSMGKIPGDYRNRTTPDFSNEKFGASQLMNFHFTEYLIKLIRNSSNVSYNIAPGRESRAIAKNSMADLIRDYLAENVYNELNLSDLYVKFLIGKSQLNNMFRECTGMSPMQYYHKLKIDEAKKLLRENNLSVSEITDKLCYSGIQNFSRAFKTATGFSPLEYKKSIL